MAWLVETVHRPHRSGNPWVYVSERVPRETLAFYVRFNQTDRSGKLPTYLTTHSIGCSGTPQADAIPTIQDPPSPVNNMPTLSALLFIRHSFSVAFA